MKIITLLLVQLLLVLLLIWEVRQVSSDNVRILEDHFAEESPSRLSKDIQNRVRHILNDFENTTVCVPCPVGTFTNSKWKPISNCSNFCDNGFCPENMTIECIPCRPGTFNAHLNASECYECDPGSIAPLKRAENCSVCPPGTSNNSRSTACPSCPAGTKAPDSGTAVCESCVAGQYSGQGSLECQDCYAGSYNPNEGSSSCIPCGEGKWNPQEGSSQKSACKDCPDGYYCPSTVNAAPEACPSDHYCVDGSSSPKSCSPMFEASEASVSCHAQAELYIIVALGSAFVVILFFSIVWYKTRVSPLPPKPESKHKTTESDRLIPPAAEGPVYEGL